MSYICRSSPIINCFCHACYVDSLTIILNTLYSAFLNIYFLINSWSYFQVTLNNHFTTYMATLDENHTKRNGNLGIPYAFFLAYLAEGRPKWGNEN